MPIKKYIANKDTTITNAFRSDLLNRATGSNTGEADTMEIFTIYGQAATASVELSRVLIDFPISNITTDRTAGTIPASGSVNFYLRLYNAEHSYTVPRKATYSILPISQSWTEGYGVDLDEHSDSGSVNWNVALTASSGLTYWDTAGGDYHTASYVPATNVPFYTAYLEKGIEDIELDITSLVEEWMANTNGEATTPYGVGVQLTSSIEAAASSSYTKKFFTRGSEFFFKRPAIEARWDSTTKDQRGSFYVSSSLASATDNLNTIYLYNYVRGQLKNIPDIAAGAIYVQIWDAAASGSQLTTTPVTGGAVSTGIYSASVAVNTTASYVYDRWFGYLLTASCYHTGTIKVLPLPAYQTNPTPRYAVAILNQKGAYSTTENARFRVFIRDKDWCPTIYTKMTTDIEFKIVEDAYYKISRVIDNETIMDYGTGSIKYSRLSYDVSGSYFDFDMDLLEPGYSYEIRFLFDTNGSYREQEEKFKFRVE